MGAQYGKEEEREVGVPEKPGGQGRSPNKGSLRGAPHPGTQPCSPAEEASLLRVLSRWTALVTVRVPLCPSSPALEGLRRTHASQPLPSCTRPSGHRPPCGSSPSTPGQGPPCSPTAHPPSHGSPGLSLPYATRTLTFSRRLWTPSMQLVALPHPGAPPKAAIAQDEERSQAGGTPSPTERRPPSPGRTHCTHLIKDVCLRQSRGDG